MLAMSVKQAAEELGLSPKTIYRRIAKGEIKILQSNGVIRIPIDQFTTKEDPDRNNRIWGNSK